MAFSGNTCLQLSHIYVLWKHTMQLGKLLSKQRLLSLIKGNVFTILQIKKHFGLPFLIAFPLFSLQSENTKALLL